VATGGERERPRRRRRRPEDAREEILVAATALLADGGSDITVSAIMGRTTLSRKSFYVYFRDLPELLTALVAPLRQDADAALRRWRDAEDRVAAGREALRSAADLYRRHGAVLRTLASAAGRDDEIRAAWDGFVEPVVDVGVETITAAVASGRSSGVDPASTAAVLVTMNVHTLLQLRPDATDAELDAVVDVLATVWERTIYDRPAPR
jgi:AcrR family transcriptional regulator